MDDETQRKEREARWPALLRALTYGIIMCPDPLKDEYVDGALVAVDRRALGGTPEEYLTAIAAGLASTQDLASLLGQSKPDALVRAFLQRVQARLVARA